MSDKIKRSDLITDDGKFTVVGALGFILFFSKAVEMFCKCLKDLEDEKK